MADAVKTKIIHEFEEKRRNAEMKAHAFKQETYRRLPFLSSMDAKISDTATAYTKRMIAGENVRDEMSLELEKLFLEKNSYLEQNGLSADAFEPQYSCKACNDTGYANGTVCTCFQKRVIEENFKSSNIGDTLSFQTFENFSFDFYSDELYNGYSISPRDLIKKNYTACLNFVKDFDNASKSLLFLGGTGLGKTFLSTCVANKLLSLGKSVIYISAVDFFKRIEKARFDNENTDVLLFENCDLLIIDDLGTEAPSVYTTAVFSDILDKRIRLGKKMIFSSNNALSEFKNLYGERVYSRLAGEFDCRLFIGSDIRTRRFRKEED